MYISGTTKMFLQVNKPPSGGSCSFSPGVIESGEPVFLECRDWIDPDWTEDDKALGIQSYAIAGKATA